MGNSDTSMAARSRRWLAAALLIICAAGCPNPPSPVPSAAPASTSPVQFVDRAADWNVKFQYQNGEQAGRYSILETLGGGVGLFDYDRDGRTDVWGVGGGSFTRTSKAPTGLAGALFRNRGIQFESVTTTAGIVAPSHYQHGVAAADYDQDGFVDALITGYGGLQLWHNLGDGTFEDVTATTGLIVDTRWSSSAAWGDFNQDGHLDLYVTHYVNWSPENDPPCYTHGDLREVCSPLVFDAVSDVLFQSDGSGGFGDRSKEIGLAEGGKGMSALVADLDLDGDVDVYVGNDTTPKYLYENVDGQLRERGMLSGVSLSKLGAAEGSMGTDLSDFDLDGLPDLWVANFEDETFGLYKNLGGMQFEHVSHETGLDRIGQAYVGWGVVFGDWNLDGDEDVFVSNGHVVRHAHKAPIQQHPVLMENLAGKQFKNMAELTGAYFRTAHPGRGAATSDLDLDGDLDLVVSHVNQPVAVLENQGPSVSRSLTVELTGTKSPRWAIGTVVRLITTQGLQIRQWRGGGSFASTSDPRLLFGIPVGQSPVRLEVSWPSGLRETIPLETSTHRIHVVEGEQHLPGRLME